MGNFFTGPNATDKEREKQELLIKEMVAERIRLEFKKAIPELLTTLQFRPIERDEHNYILTHLQKDGPVIGNEDRRKEYIAIDTDNFLNALHEANANIEVNTNKISAYIPALKDLVEKRKKELSPLFDGTFSDGIIGYIDKEYRTARDHQISKLYDQLFHPSYVLAEFAGAGVQTEKRPRLVSYESIYKNSNLAWAISLDTKTLYLDTDTLKNMGFNLSKEEKIDTTWTDKTGNRPCESGDQSLAPRKFNSR